MSKLTDRLHKSGAALTSRTAKAGSYSILITVIVLAILIAVNIFVGELPTKYTWFDISAQQLYSVTSSTKAVVQNLEKDVTVYWVTQAGKEDSVLEKLLGVYDGLSDHLTVVKKDPDIYPTFAAQYTDEDVSNNSLIVECGERSRFVSYSDIYEYDYSDYYTTGSYTINFAGEGGLTSAISYVVTDDLPKAYVLTGHDETELGTEISDAIENQNIETESFTLINADAVPDDAACVIINAPQSDISEDEAEKLISYVQGGGKLMVFSGPQEDAALTNLNSVLEHYGVTVNEGVVIESDRSGYASYPYMLLADIEDTDITATLLEGTHYVIVPIASGLTVGSSSNGTVTELLTKTDTAFSKAAGYSMETYEREDGDIDGPFALGILIDDAEGDGQIVWFSSDNMLSDNIISYSSGSNSDITMNAMSYLIGETDAISIRSKSMDYSYLTIPDSSATLIKIVMIGVVPLLYLAFGLDEIIRRRKQA